jgi:hypothetical protein
MSEPSTSTNPKLLRATERAAPKMPHEALSAVETAFLRVMRTRHPEHAWELERVSA